MRIKIDTKGKPVTDIDIQALYMLVYALDKSSPTMKINNLRFIANKYGYELVKK